VRRACVVSPGCQTTVSRLRPRRRRRLRTF
jgi:hypothetical protein